MNEITYALNSENKLVYIDTVKNGLKCNCICPACKEKLVAKNAGRIKNHHFAHFSNHECVTAFQTVLHLLAKEIFLEVKKFSFRNFKNEIITYQIMDVLLEKKFGDIIPDIILNCDGKSFIVEIFVSHPIDEAKKEKIRKMNISTVEYDLSKVDRNISKEGLQTILFGNPKIRWNYDGDEKRIKTKKKFLFENGDKIKILHDRILCHCSFKYDVWLQTGQTYNWHNGQVPEHFCKNCTFCGGKTENNEIICGARFYNLKNFDYATFVAKNEVLLNKQLESYIKNFDNEMRKWSC